MLAALAPRRPLRAAPTLRALATAHSPPYVPPASLQNVSDAPPARFRPRKKSKPDSPSFYTSRASYYDHLYQLEKAVERSQRTLRTLSLLPLPAFARASLPPAQHLWRNRQSLAPMFSGALTTARYRRMIDVLTELEESARIAAAAGYTAFAEKIQDVLAVFERSDKANVLSRTMRKHVPLDRHGRSFTVGKRKESAARVWMIPVREPPSSSPTPAAATATAPTTSADTDTDLLAPVVGGAFTPSPAAPPRVPVTTTTILVNNVPLNQFFPSPTDRERVVRPLKLAGVIGAFNVFSIVRGGGTSGQAGAVAHGIAQGIVAHVPEVDPILRKAKLMKRDPRMVERKKTGLAKARKRYTWVKR